MKLLLDVHGEEHSDHADYALLHLTEETARRFLEMRNLVRQAQILEDQFLRMEFRFDGVVWLADPNWERGDEGPCLYEVLDELLADNKDWHDHWADGGLVLPEGFEVPERLHQWTEVNVVVMYPDEVVFQSYPRHDDYKQETAGVRFELIEEVAGFRVPDEEQGR